MKKAILSAVLVLLMMLSYPSCAFADVIYPAPEDVEAGTYMNHRIASMDSGGEASASGLPEGVSLESQLSENGEDLYLRGTPSSPGIYSSVININGTSAICTFTVTPSVPVLSVGGGGRCATGELIQLSVSATVSDKGSLSYQWYVSTDEDTASGLPISGADSSLYLPGTGQAGRFYYYCVVTNQGGGLSVSVTSPMITVLVAEPEPMSIRVERGPARLTYHVGEVLDPEGLKIRVELPDGESRVIDQGFTLSPTLLQTVGIQLIEVSYGGKTCSFPVTVEPAEEIIEGIGVLTLPYQTQYSLGDTLDPRGLSIRVYTNLGHRDVDSGLVCSPMKLEQSGDQLISVSYEDKTCTFTVQVRRDETPVSLAVGHLPDKTRYVVGEALDMEGLVLILSESSGRTEEITSGYSYSPSRVTVAGEQEIAVYYEDLSCRFRVSVEEEPVESPEPTAPPSAPPSSAPSPHATAQPEPTPLSPGYDSNLGRNLVGVIVVASLLALGVLGAYVFIMNRGGLDLFLEQLKKRFGRK